MADEFGVDNAEYADNNYSKEMKNRKVKDSKDKGEFVFKTVDVNGKEYVFLGITKDDLVRLFSRVAYANEQAFKKIYETRVNQKAYNQAVNLLNEATGSVFLTMLDIFRSENTVNLDIVQNKENEFKQVIVLKGLQDKGANNADKD